MNETESPSVRPSIGKRRATPASRAATASVLDYAIALQRIDGANRKLRHAIARSVGLGVSELVTLVVVQELEIARPSVLADEVGITSGAMTTMLDRLVAAGYVQRHPHQQDRRSVVIELTDEGIGVLAVVSERYIGAIASVVEGSAALQDPHVIDALHATAEALES